MLPQYLTLRSRKLVRKSFSKKAYPKKRELRPLLPKPCTSPPAYTEINRDNTWQSIGAAPQPVSSTFVTVVTDTLQIANKQTANPENFIHITEQSVTEQFDTIDKELVNEMLPDIQPQNTPLVPAQTTEIKTIPAPVQKDKQPTLELIQGYKYKKKTSANNCTPLSVVPENPLTPEIAPVAPENSSAPVTVENPPLSQASQPTEMTDLTQFAGSDIMAVGHSKINCLFPDITLDKVVLFGKNFNFTYPVSPGFHPSALCTHFVCLGVFPLKLGIMVPTDFPDIGPEECVAITINDIPFNAKIFNIEEIHQTLYANFRK